MDIHDIMVIVFDLKLAVSNKVQLSEGQNSYDMRFIFQYQKGESEAMDLPFLFLQSPIFRNHGLTSDLKVRYGSNIHLVSVIITKNLIFVHLSIYHRFDDIWFFAQYLRFLSSAQQQYVEPHLAHFKPALRKAFTSRLIRVLSLNGTRCAKRSTEN